MKITDFRTRADILPEEEIIDYQYGQIKMYHYPELNYCELIFSETKYPYNGRIVNTKIRIFLGHENTSSRGNTFYTPIDFVRLYEFLKTDEVNIEKLRIFLDPDKHTGSTENVITLFPPTEP